MPEFRLPKKTAAPEATPEPEREHVTQEMAEVVPMLGLDLAPSVCRVAVTGLQPILAETLQLAERYHKSHWQAQGPDFYSLHLMFDAHYGKQLELADFLAERIQQLGGVAVAQGVNVARLSNLSAVPAGRECVASQMTGLLNAHRDILSKCRYLVGVLEKLEDYTSCDILTTDVLRFNEKQAWFLSSHLTPPCEE